MLDPEAPEERRDTIAAETRKLIESAGTLADADHWGMRKMSYEIQHRGESDYHLFRFSGENPLLEQLDHTLKITEGVLRFRIFATEADAPKITPPAAMIPGPGGGDPRGRGRDGGGRDGGERDRERE